MVFFKVGIHIGLGLIGKYSNVLREGKCRYAVPSYWDIGAVYARLIEDVAEGGDLIIKLLEVYASWMSEALSRFNSDLFYQSRGYIAECYRAGTIIVA